MVKSDNDDFDDPHIDHEDNFEDNENKVENDNKNGWIQMPTDEEVKMHNTLESIAYSRLPKDTTDIDEMNINDFIASLTNLSCSPLHKPPYSNLGEKLEDIIGVYVYLRDNFKITRGNKKRKIETVLEADEFILKKGKVNPKVVAVWLEAEILISSNALKESYPQFKEQIESLEEKYRTAYNKITFLKRGMPYKRKIK